MSNMDKIVYNTQLEVRKSVGDNKRENLIYYLAVQPCHP
jgi:hypothetical protein